MRADLEIIQDWIPAGSRVLDLGCGDGELLSWLRDNKQVTGYGLENDPDNIAQCVAKGINVIEQDLDKGLGNFASNSFDIVVMTQAVAGDLLVVPQPAQQFAITAAQVEHAAAGGDPFLDDVQVGSHGVLTQ